MINLQFINQLTLFKYRFVQISCIDSDFAIHSQSVKMIQQNECRFSLTYTLLFSLSTVCSVAKYLDVPDNFVSIRLIQFNATNQTIDFEDSI